MKKNVKRGLLACLAVGVALIGGVSYTLYSSAYGGDQTAYVYLDRDDTTDSLIAKLDRVGCSTTAFTMLSKVKSYKLRTGRYGIEPGTNGLTLFRKLRNGQQDPVMMTIPDGRTMDKLAGIMARSIMLDSLEIYRALTDTILMQRLGYTPETFPALFIPNTYEVFWDMDVEKLFKRITEEHQRFWNDERCHKAEALGLTPTEVYTLASIVDEETASKDEKPMVAGLYLNRLRRGMMLQADPTVKKAVGDWSLRRILNAHLAVESPYNTYRHLGLPPGPIRVTTIAGIDAVLNHADHNYLYMCAKEDFSGTHNFAATYTEHLANARRYTDALNRKGIR